VEDYQKLLRDADREVEEALKQRRAEAERIQAAEREYEEAWDAVIACCLAGDRNDQYMPDLSPFLKLACLLKARGMDCWVPEMAKNLADDRFSKLMSRRDELFIVNLLTEALKDGATAQSLASIYQSRTKGQVYPNWRATAASDIRYFFTLRLEQARKDAQSMEDDKTQKDRLDQMERVKKAAARGQAWRNLQFLLKYRELEGSDTTERLNATIRDWWNDLHPDRPCHPERDRRKGAEVVRAGIRSAAEFVKRIRSTGVTLSIEEMIAAIGQDP
jgi:hypothetical protein